MIRPVEMTDSILNLSIRNCSLKLPQDFCLLKIQKKEACDGVCHGSRIKGKSLCSRSI
jgi:hypothetical protein